MPDHLPPHPTHQQPAHDQPLNPHQSSSQQQTVHAPTINPAVQQSQQQQQQQQNMAHPHHMQGAGPPQSATPQSHYQQQMNVAAAMQHGNMAAGIQPRTSLATSVGFSYINMSAPQYSYPSVSEAPQYSYAPAPQPQTSQNSSHGEPGEPGGPQPQYVVMPQHTNQPYPAAGLQFPAKHNIMQGLCLSCL